MLNIDSIENGVVIDHITAGKGMTLYRHLHLSELSCPVAVIQNARSNRQGRKDIIKIEGLLTLDLDVIGFVDPNATVIFIQDGAIVEKKNLQLPKTVVNVVSCKNPRCITTTEPALPQVFVLDEASGSYCCHYCEHQR